MKNRIILILILLLSSRAIYAVDPSRQYSQTPESMKLPYKEVQLTTSDHYKLKAWELQPFEKLDKSTTIVVAYNGEGNMSSWLYRAGALSKAGYRVLLFDYRGFGESQDFQMKKEQLYYDEFAYDLTAAIRYAKKNKKNKLTGVLAFSEGSVTAVRTVQTEQVDFLVLDGAVLDLIKLKQRYLSTESRTVQIPPGAEGFTSLYDKISARMLIFAGLKDSLTTVADAQSIAVKQPSMRQVQVFNGDHLQSFDVLTGQVAGDYYINRITGFLAPLRPEEKKK